MQCPCLLFQESPIIHFSLLLLPFFLVSILLANRSCAMHGWSNYPSISNKVSCYIHSSFLIWHNGYQFLLALHLQLFPVLLNSSHEFHVFADDIQWRGLDDPSPIIYHCYQLLLSIFKSSFPCFHLPLEIPLNISSLGGLLWASVQLRWIIVPFYHSHIICVSSQFH